MSYILSQNIILVLVAALVGAGIAYFMGLCNCNTAELEAERDSLRAERDTLVSRVDGGVADAGAGQTNAAYERKIAGLEAELAQARGRADALANEVAKSPAPQTPEAPEADLNTEDVTAMRWRNRYLEARVKYLEEQSSEASPANLPEEAAANNDKKAPKSKAIPAPKPAGPALASMSADALEAAVLAAAANAKAPPRSRKRANRDDLLMIDGVGPKNQAWLNEQGIYYYQQIADMSIENMAWLAENLPTFGSRVYRDNWAAQCANLAKGLPARG